jgi:hypothetical protein
MRAFPGFALVLVLAGLAAWFLVATTETAPPTEMTAEEEAAIVAEIDSLTVEWWEAWKTFDWDRGLAFIEDGPQTTWTGAVQTVSSVQEMREVWIPAMAGFQRQDFEFTNSRTIVLAPDIVWTLREGNGSLFDTDGNLVSENQFIETAVWVKRGGEWKLLLGHDDDSTPIT